MDLSFDHLVWFTKSPKEAVSLTKEIGLHTVMGGSHKAWGTFNSVAYFGLPYIEFLGIENFEIAKKVHDNQLVSQILNDLPNGDGPARIALRTHDIEGVAAHLKKHGIPTIGPFPGSRLTPDGQLLKWSLLFPKTEGLASLPFIIDWKVSDEERKRQLHGQGFDGIHFNHHPEFAQIGFVVRNLDETIDTWQKLFGLEKGERFESEELNAVCQVLKLPDNHLYFYSPVGKGVAEKTLSVRGARPFLVGFQKTGQKKELELLGGSWHLS